MSPRPDKPQPDSRTWQLLSLVARRGPLTTAELVKDLGVTTTAVRQQTTRLLWGGWLVRERRSRGPGRPADVFSLSEQGRRLFAHEVDEFARLLVQELQETDGPAKVQALLGRVARHLASDMERQVGGGPAAERVEQMVRLLQQRGTVAEVAPIESGLRLSLFTCPYHGLGPARHEICEMERQALGRLAGGTARLGGSIENGQPSCEFQVALEVQATVE